MKGKRVRNVLALVVAGLLLAACQASDNAASQDRPLRGPYVGLGGGVGFR